MIRKVLLSLLAAAALSAVTAPEAAAWGERAQRSLSTMALQVIKTSYPYAFQSEGSNYENDVIAGSIAGAAALSDSFSTASEQAVIQSIGTEIEMLREIRGFGTGSYFAYRMGALGGVVADLMLPYGLANTPDAERLAAQIAEDIDAHLGTYSYKATQRTREFIREPSQFFARRRSFVADDVRIIAQDYSQKHGYNGFLKDGGPAYFSRSVDAIADVWHTILREEADPSQGSTSPRMLTWYFVDEIGYLLGEKRNVNAADRAYDNFLKVNQQVPEAYEQIGDQFYQLGTEVGIKRAVREWRVAHNIGGTTRNRVASKLSGHFLEEGRVYLARTSEPGAAESDYTSALRSFEQALEFDRSSDEAAKLIQQTNVAIQERNERFQTTVEFISKGEQIREKADNMRNAEDFGNAIQTYRAAIVPYEAVDEEFEDQSKQAKDAVSKIKSEIATVINKVLSQASDLIEEGDRDLEEFKFEDAIAKYERVPSVLSIVSDEESNTVVDRRNELTELAATKVDDAKRQKMQADEANKPGPGGAPKFGQKPAGAPGAPGGPGGPPPPGGAPQFGGPKPPGQ
jgi:tetratricopeptide (TPR) repeat protein